MYPITEDGTRVYVDDGRVEAYLNILESFSAVTGMRLNKTKTASLSFNYGHTHVSFGDLSFSNGEKIVVQNDLKLLGVVVDNKLTLDGFIKQRRSSAISALWSVQRLLAQGVDKGATSLLLPVLC